MAAREAQATPFGHRDELHRFLIGINLRDEQLTAPELRDLLEAVPAPERDALAGFIEDGLALLASYDRLVAAEDAAYGEGVHDGYQV